MKAVTGCKRTSYELTRRTIVTRVTKNLVTWGARVDNLIGPVANLVGEHNPLRQNECQRGKPTFYILILKGIIYRGRIGAPPGSAPLAEKRGFSAYFQLRLTLLAAQRVTKRDLIFPFKTRFSTFRALAAQRVTSTKFSTPQKKVVHSPPIRTLPRIPKSLSNLATKEFQLLAALIS